MCGYFARMDAVRTVYMFGAHGDQKKESDPLELNLRTFVSLFVGAGNHSRVLYKFNKFS